MQLRRTVRNKAVLLMLVFFLLSFASACRERTPTPLDFAVRMAESVMTRHPGMYSGWDYVTGVMMKAFERIWRQTGDDRYYQYILRTVDPVIEEDGTIAGYDPESYNIDQINEGRALLFLYQHTNEGKYKKAADALRNQLAAHPRTSDPVL